MNTQAIAVDDCDAYLGTFVSGSTRIVLAGRGSFRSTIKRARTSEIWVRQAITSVANILHLGVPGRAVFAINASQGPCHRIDGSSLEQDCMVWQTAGAEATVHDPGGMTCISYSFPTDSFEAASLTLFNELPPRLHTGSMTLKVPPTDAAASRRLLALALELPLGPTRQMAAELLHVTLARLHAHGRGATAGTHRPVPARQRSVDDGLIGLADTIRDRPLPLAEVCQSLLVNLRTLNACSNAILGMSAGRYLRARRLQTVRTFLRSGNAESVTDAATRFGFFELGRFAGEYRAAYGELPAETLRRARRQAAP